MKKTIAVLAISIVAFSSCKKDWTCRVYGTDAMGQPFDGTFILENKTKSDAKKDCEQWAQTFNISNSEVY